VVRLASMEWFRSALESRLMENPQKPRLDPRMVFALVFLAIPVLYLVAQVILVRSGDDCAEAGESAVGGVTQLFVPGVGCPVEPKGR
jgi:hypothetical protein